MSVGTFIILVSTLISVVYQAVNFSKLTACRQEAWLKSTELLTNKKINSDSKVVLFHSDCKLRISGNQEIFWQEIQSGKFHKFKLKLSGNL